MAHMPAMGKQTYQPKKKKQRANMVSQKTQRVDDGIEKKMFNYYS